MRLIQRIKESANRATEKAQHAVEISKINSQITAIQQEMDVHFLRMGQIFYEGYRASDMSVAETEMTQLSTACDELQDEIDELRSRIAQLKNAHLCTCGAVVPLDANFCPKCGCKLNDEQTASGQVAAVREEIPKDAYSFDLHKPEIAKKAEPVYTEYTEHDVYEQHKQHEQERDELQEMHEPAGSEHNYAVSDFTPEEKAAFDEEWERRRQEEIEKEHRRLQELERERERQEELDERIRYWKANNSGAEKPATQVREHVKCQICTAELPKGSKWCPRCGAEQI